MTPTLIQPPIANVAGSVRERVRSLGGPMRQVLQQAIAFPSVSGSEGPMVQYIAAWARQQGLGVDLWQATEADIAAYPQAAARHMPLAGRPTLVIKLPGTGNGPSLAFNAHSDVVAAPERERWSVDPWAGVMREGRMYGRGACDTKGPLVSALLALVVLQERRQRLAGDVLVELIPGEEDCVGVGTLTSVARGYKPDAVVVLEPTESLPRCASRAGTRFEITCIGRAVHGTVKWTGVDAIGTLREVLTVLAEMEKDFGKLAVDPLFDGYPIARPITVDVVRGGRWQGMVCDQTQCAGYFELLPGDVMGQEQKRFESELRQRLQARGSNPERVMVSFIETYDGHRLETQHRLAKCAAAAVEPDSFVWQGFNSGCEAGLRATVLNTPTLVWGPGSLMQAHAVDEYVVWADVERVAEMFVQLAVQWTGGND